MRSMGPMANPQIDLVFEAASLFRVNYSVVLIETASFCGFLDFIGNKNWMEFLGNFPHSVIKAEIKIRDKCGFAL